MNYIKFILLLPIFICAQDIQSPICGNEVIELENDFQISMMEDLKKTWNSLTQLNKTKALITKII